MIIVFGGKKHGSGKTTMVTNLSVMRAEKGHNVLLIDANVPQCTATYWNRLRDGLKIKPSIFYTQKSGRLDDEIIQLSKKFDDIIIDTGGEDTKELRSSMLVADYTYVPLQPSQFDMWTIEKMADLVKSSQELNLQLKASVILNRASTNPRVSEINEAKESLKNLNNALNFSQAIIRDRIAFKKAAKNGMAVTEIKPADKKAIKEMKLLYQEIYHD